MSGRARARPGRARGTPRARPGPKTAKATNHHAARVRRRRPHSCEPMALIRRSRGRENGLDSFDFFELDHPAPRSSIPPHSTVPLASAPTPLQNPPAKSRSQVRSPRYFSRQSPLFSCGPAVLVTALYPRGFPTPLTILPHLPERLAVLVSFRAATSGNPLPFRVPTPPLPTKRCVAPTTHHHRPINIGVCARDPRRPSTIPTPHTLSPPTANVDPELSTYEPLHAQRPPHSTSMNRSIRRHVPPTIHPVVPANTPLQPFRATFWQARKPSLHLVAAGSTMSPRANAGTQIPRDSSRSFLSPFL